MSTRTLFIIMFALGAIIGGYIVFTRKKQVLEDLAGETKPTIVTE